MDENIYIEDYLYVDPDAKGFSNRLIEYDQKIIEWLTKNLAIHSWAAYLLIWVATLIVAVTVIHLLFKKEERKALYYQVSCGIFFTLGLLAMYLPNMVNCAFEFLEPYAYKDFISWIPECVRTFYHNFFDVPHKMNGHWVNFFFNLSLGVTLLSFLKVLFTKSWNDEATFLERLSATAFMIVLLLIALLIIIGLIPIVYHCLLLICYIIPWIAFWGYAMCASCILWLTLCLPKVVIAMSIGVKAVCIVLFTCLLGYGIKSI